MFILGEINLSCYEAKVISNPTSQSTISPSISVYSATNTKLTQLKPHRGHGELRLFLEEEVYAVVKQK